jgi:hypothetical protein
VDRNKTLAKILRERDAEIARRAPRYPQYLGLMRAQPAQGTISRASRMVQLVGADWDLRRCPGC